MQGASYSIHSEVNFNVPVLQSLRSCVSVAQLAACPHTFLAFPAARHWESYARAEIRQLRKALEAQQGQQAEQQQQGGAG